jgi:hypothetical protein
MDWLQLIDDTLGTHFNAPVYDPAKGRAKLLKVIDTAAEQHREGKTPKVRSWKTGNNGAISFSPKIANKPVLIRDKATSYVAAEKFQDFLAGMRKSVEAGDLDKEIKAALDDKGTGSLGGGKKTSTPRGQGLGNKARPDDAEWMAKFREKVGEPDPSIVDPVPNSKGTKWVPRANTLRGQNAAAARYGTS